LLHHKRATAHITVQITSVSLVYLGISADMWISYPHVFSDSPFHKMPWNKRKWRWDKAVDKAQITIFWRHFQGHSCSDLLKHYARSKTHAKALYKQITLANRDIKSSLFSSKKLQKRRGLEWYSKPLTSKIQKLCTIFLSYTH
jgi:hypothetical protein